MLKFRKRERKDVRPLQEKTNNQENLSLIGFQNPGSVLDPNPRHIFYTGRSNHTLDTNRG